jgi:sugar (pentulose or hexulose) kinase
MSIPVIVIFDVGKTNKKVLLFDEQCKLLHEESIQLEETVDEDGFPCEDVNLLTKWLKQKFSEILLRKDMDVKAVNFSAYGASFVNIDRRGNVITPLYNYLKPFPDQIKKKFYDTYGGESLIAKQTASPVLGSLNSGMQLYRLKYEKPEVYQKIEYSLHLPQYLSFIVSKNPASDISSVGCHTNLWDFKNSDYHRWVFEENLNKKLAPLYNGNKVIGAINDKMPVGIGLHDSSAALIPYLSSFKEPFVLISTGTWNISLNPFNHAELTY